MLRIANAVLKSRIRLRRRAGPGGGASSLLGLDVKLVGANRVLLRLDKVGRKTRNLKKMWTHVGQKVIAHYVKNMTRGVGPDRKKLAEVEKWTRRVRVGIGNRKLSKMTPLVATGGLRNSLKIKEKSRRHVVIGFTGKYESIAEDATSGEAGRMMVKKKLIKTRKLGVGKYIRVQTNDGTWITKKVSGQKVDIDPRARKFFFLSRKQKKLIRKEARAWLYKNIWKNT